LRLSSVRCDGLGDFVPGARIRFQLDTSPEKHSTRTCSNGPGRARKFTSIRSIRRPQSSRAAGFAGINNVIRSVFLELTHNYGVRHVLGIRNGFWA
jgi:hypothetical protein